MAKRFGRLRSLDITPPEPRGRVDITDITAGQFVKWVESGKIPPDAFIEPGPEDEGTVFAAWYIKKLVTKNRRNRG